MRSMVGMSRLAKKPITIPEGVTVVVEGSRVRVRGPKGEMARLMHPDVVVVIQKGEKTLSVSLGEEAGKNMRFVGTARALVNNMIHGVVEGFTKVLELEGIGYRVEKQGQDLIFSLGFSHPVRFTLPEGVDGAIERNVITIRGIDRERVGEAASAIRALKKPEPYKGKGIHYQGEYIRRKAGKKAVGTT